METKSRYCRSVRKTTLLVCSEFGADTQETGKQGRHRRTQETRAGPLMSVHCPGDCEAPRGYYLGDAEIYLIILSVLIETCLERFCRQLKLHTRLLGPSTTQTVQLVRCSMDFLCSHIDSVPFQHTERNARQKS